MRARVRVRVRVRVCACARVSSTSCTGLHRVAQGVLRAAWGVRGACGTSPVRESSTLAALMSRWILASPCKYSSPLSTCSGLGLAQGWAQD